MIKWKEINKVKQKLKEGKCCIGPWVHMGHPDVAEILSMVGFDFLIYDTEHAPLNLERIQNMIQVMEGSGVVPLIRVAWNTPFLIKRALDIGSYGVLIPWINTQEEAIQAVMACKYPPHGIRGCGPRRAANYGLDFSDYLERFAQEEIFVMIQIETQKAIENLDEILSTEGIDAAFVGPLDLSVSLGTAREWNNPILKKSIQKVLDKCRQYNVFAGIDGLDVEDVKERVSQGFQFISFSSDTDFLLSAATEAWKKLSNLTDRDL